MNRQVFRVNLAMVPALFLLLVSLSACQSGESLIETPTTNAYIVSETNMAEITTTPTENRVEAVTSTPLPNAPFLPTLTETSAPTSIPTVSPVQNIQKIAELPVVTSNFIILDSGKLLVYQDIDEVIYVLDTNDWQIKSEFDLADWEWNGYMVRDFSIDGRYLAGGGVNANVYVWDMMTGETVYVFDVSFHTVNNVSFSPDGRYLAASAIETYSGQSLMVWDLITGQQIPNPTNLQNYGPNVLAIKFIPSQTNLLAITTANLKAPEEFEEGERIGGLYFWNIDTGEVQELVSGIGGVGLGTSPNGLVVGAEVDEFYRFWDMQNDKEILNLKWENLGEVKSLAISDMGVIAAADSDKLLVWNVQGELLASFIPERTISKIEFISDDELLIAYYADPPVLLEIWQVVE